MSTKQNIKGVKAGGGIDQSIQGGPDSITQTIEDSEATGNILQRTDANYLRLGKFRASGVVAVIALGILAVIYVVFKK